MSASPSSSIDYSLYPPLKRAIVNDDVEQLSSLLLSLSSSPSFDINLINFDSPPPSSSSSSGLGRTLLFHACSGPVARSLLDHGADPSIRDKYGRSALHVAAERNRASVVEEIARKATHIVNEQDKAGNAAIHETTEPEIVRLLVSCGADVNSSNSLGLSPLHLSSRGGRLALTETLLQLGADAYKRNEEGRMPIHLACETGHKDIVTLLLDSPLILPRLSVNLPDSAGWCCLHFACRGSPPEHESHPTLVSFLLLRGADYSLADVSGMQAIHVCTDASALRVLLQAGADPDASDSDGRTPLHLLHADSCVVILDQKKKEIQRNRKDRWGRTALHEAAEPNKAMLLIKKGWQINEIDHQGKTPLDWSIATDRPDVTRMLRQFNAKLSEELNDKRGPQTEHNKQSNTMNNETHTTAAADTNKCTLM